MDSPFLRATFCSMRKVRPGQVFGDHIIMKDLTLSHVQQDKLIAIALHLRGHRLRELFEATLPAA